MNENFLYSQQCYLYEQIGETIGWRDTVSDIAFVVLLIFGIPASALAFGLILEGVKWLARQPYVSVSDAKLFENGYVLVQFDNDGYVPDRVKSVVLIYKDKAYVGQIINATSDVIPPKGECWVLVKFNVTLPTGTSAMLKFTFESSHYDWTITKVLPASLIPEKQIEI